VTTHHEYNLKTVFDEMVIPSGTILATNRRLLPGSNAGGRWESSTVYIAVVVVLVAGGVGDYAAYEAAANDPAWAAKNGNKLTYDQACFHFPGVLEKNRYRP